MKKNIKKFITDSFKKIKKEKMLTSKFRFSSFKEDFVITAQEEREGGYFGILNFKTT